MPSTIFCLWVFFCYVKHGESQNCKFFMFGGRQLSQLTEYLGPIITINTFRGHWSRRTFSFLRTELCRHALRCPRHK